MLRLLSSEIEYDSLPIIRFRCKSCVLYRAAAFDVTGRKILQHPPLYSILSIRMNGKKVVSSTVIFKMRTARNLPSTTVSAVAVAQFPCQLIKLSSYVTQLEYKRNDTFCSAATGLCVLFALQKYLIT